MLPCPVPLLTEGSTSESGRAALPSLILPLLWVPLIHCSQKYPGRQAPFLSSARQYFIQNRRMSIPVFWKGGVSSAIIFFKHMARKFTCSYRDPQVHISHLPTELGSSLLLPELFLFLFSFGQLGQKLKNYMTAWSGSKGSFGCTL